MSDSIEAIARHETDVAEAREALTKLTARADGYLRAYAILSRWAWRAMIERRLDGELRSWHRLLLDTSSRIASKTGASEDSRGRPKLSPQAVAERLRAYAELVRMSVEAADASVPAELVARAHVAEILRALAESGGYVDRAELKVTCGLKEANLSRVMTLLHANGLVEREPRGRKAAFRITARGLEAAKVPDRKSRDEERILASRFILPQSDQAAMLKNVHRKKEEDFYIHRVNRIRVEEHRNARHPDRYEDGQLLTACLTADSATANLESANG